MYIYAFGSVCRGEIDTSSDVDLLAILDNAEHGFDPLIYSIYSYCRLQELWVQGNPFAWHLHLESKLIYTLDGSDPVAKLGSPAKYTNAVADCEKFYAIFLKAKEEILSSSFSEVFELSNIFLSMRNFATCYSLQYCREPVFSRDSSIQIGLNSLDIQEDIYDIYRRARMLCTRGIGVQLTDIEISEAKSCMDYIDEWMKYTLAGVS
ncbi:MULTISPECIES: nucleotidyltransferase [Cobetia]|uniref:nucleotidyltransferase n=1 Tax=Cobetia TaxID=204286 RepID=UPI00158301C4|nr:MULTISPECIES: nucleotidyltransferase [Cobetia]MDI4659746.1 hypothetical protein [Cobetia sp. BMC6]NUJ55153.1 nucleotidyltransferase [Cobetia marina]